MQSQTEAAMRASGLEKELVIDRYGFTQGSALLNDGKSSSCCFWSLAKRDGEPRGLQTGISDLLWNQTRLQLPQTRILSKEHYTITRQAEAAVSPSPPDWVWGISHQTLNPKEARLVVGWAITDGNVGHNFQFSGRRDLTKVHLRLLHTYRCFSRAGL